MHKTITLLLVTLSNIYRFKKKLTDRLSNRPFLIWLQTKTPNLQYAATLARDLSLMARFPDNVLQHSVAKLATYARCGGILNICFNYKFTKESSSKNLFYIG